MAQGFEPVDGRPGIFRKAHALWAIKAAEDGEGYVILRLRDEPAPGIEPRHATQVSVSVSVDDDQPQEEEEMMLVIPPEMRLEADPELQLAAVASRRRRR